eukprot:TRINITY_DN30240_c0_g1_i1.p1 TRINITY_DN30240_c0_g1~~TRINITY_DN30240_c0_g1_i1.p1  ORF type:complete len:397 (-),score=91.49 TRINITY_DN30240_c0_g1_i1:88-1278(-)
MGAALLRIGSKEDEPQGARSPAASSASVAAAAGCAAACGVEATASARGDAARSGRRRQSGGGRRPSFGGVAAGGRTETSTGLTAAARGAPPKGGRLRRRSKGGAAGAPRAGGLSVLRWLPCRTRKRVLFNEQVRTIVFERELGGGASVPGDGTIATLGLGRMLRGSLERLAPPARRGAPPRRPVEETAWVPAPERIRLLRRAMGDVSFFRTWVAERREVLKFRHAREDSNANDQGDVFLLPTSFAEARERAEHFAREAQLTLGASGSSAAAGLQGLPAAEDALKGTAQSKLWLCADTKEKPEALPLAPGVRGRKQRRSYGGEAEPRSKKLRRSSRGAASASPSPSAGRGRRGSFGSGTACHHCQRPIAVGPPGSRCICLEAFADEVSVPALVQVPC